MVVLAAGLVAMLAAFAIGGTHAERRIGGSNGIASTEFVAVAGPGQVLCQRGENVPAGAGFLRMTIGTYDKPGPLLRTSVETARGRRVTTGQIEPGWRQGVVDLPLGTRSAPGTPYARVCVANRSTQRIAVGGAPLGRANGARVAGRAARGRVRIEYVDGERTSAWEVAGTMASRMGFGRGLWGSLAPWLALALVVAAIGVAARALLIAAARDEDQPGEPS